VILYNFCLLSTYFLYSRRRTESGTPDVKRRSVCALVGYEFCEGINIAGAVISTVRCPLKTPSRCMHK